MSLTSYRAAPPRVNRCFAFVKVPGTVNEGPALFAWLSSFVPKASLDGHPGQRTLGAGGMYQTDVPLERATGTFFSTLLQRGGRICGLFGPPLPEVPQRASL